VLPLQLLWRYHNLLGFTFNLLLDRLCIIVGDAERTSWSILLQRLHIPLASMLNGPVVNGVTLVLLGRCDVT
jgi:hypothetical protein